MHQVHLFQQCWQSSGARTKASSALLITGQQLDNQGIEAFSPTGSWFLAAEDWIGWLPATNHSPQRLPLPTARPQRPTRLIPRVCVSQYGGFSVSQLSHPYLRPQG